jgi:hypothetical protein
MVSDDGPPRWASLLLGLTPGVEEGGGVLDGGALRTVQLDLLPDERAESRALDEQCCCGDGTRFVANLPEKVVNRPGVLVRNIQRSAVREGECD